MNRQQKKANKDAARREKVRKAKAAEDWQRQVDAFVYEITSQNDYSGIALVIDDTESIREGYLMAEATLLASERLEAEVYVWTARHPGIEGREAMWADIETFTLFLKVYRHLEAKFGHERVSRAMSGFASHAKAASDHVLATGKMPPLKSCKARAA